MKFIVNDLIPTSAQSLGMQVLGDPLYLTDNARKTN